MSLLCYNGPYIPGYYEKNTSLKDTWGVRPLNPEFDSELYLKENKVQRKKPAGWFRFTVGNSKNSLPEKDEFELMQKLGIAD